jgi:phosphoribosylformylglycinamidine cyclo-ligase
MVTYQQAGVSIEAGNELVRRIKKMVAGSKLSRSAIGGFSGLYPLPKKIGNFYLSGCCDGVGTKLKIAFLLNRHDTVGIDLVAMNVNDLICTGAQPLFFLDYFACGKLDVDTAEQVIRGIQKGCEQSGCILLGGETAEMPGFYQPGEYDLAGFAVGLVEKKDLIRRNTIRPGDLVLGLPSSGVHSNGYSLVRKVFSEKELIRHGNELITPTKIYVKPILALLKKYINAVKGIAHITGGGWLENPPRVLPKGLQIEFRKDSWPILPIFQKIQKKGNIAEQEMFRTFNMGIGLMLVVDKKAVSKVQMFLKKSYIIGEIKKGTSVVQFVD